MMALSRRNALVVVSITAGLAFASIGRLAVIAADGGVVGEHSAIQDASGPALEWFAALPDAAGAYYDRESGGGPVFQFGGETMTRRAELAALLPATVPYRVQQVQFTTAQLDGLKKRVVSAWDDLRGLGVDMISVGIDDRQNRILVGVGSSPEAAADILAGRFGQSILTRLESRPVPDACTVFNCGNPIKGGLEIISVPDPLDKCTSGWIIKRITTGQLYVLTAGHCLTISNGGVNPNESWKHAGAAFGKEIESSWVGGADGDAGLITVAIPAGQDRNWFFADGPTPLRHVTSWATTAQQIQGAEVCRNGRTTHYNCGFIALRDRTKNVDGRLIDHQWVVDIEDALPGDSGGPYFWVNKSWGIHSDSTDAAPFQSWYTPISWALLVLTFDNDDVKLCITPTC